MGKDDELQERIEATEMRMSHHLARTIEEEDRKRKAEDKEEKEERHGDDIEDVTEMLTDKEEMIEEKQTNQQRDAEQRCQPRRRQCK